MENWLDLGIFGHTQCKSQTMQDAGRMAPIRSFDIRNPDMVRAITLSHWWGKTHKPAPAYSRLQRFSRHLKEKKVEKQGT